MTVIPQASMKPLFIKSNFRRVSKEFSFFADSYCLVGDKDDGEEEQKKRDDYAI